MGFLDALILVPNLLILLVTSILLILSLRSTDDDNEKRKYLKTYTPAISLSILLLILYIGVISISNAILDY